MKYKYFTIKIVLFSITTFFSTSLGAQSNCEGITYLMSIGDKKELYKVHYENGNDQAKIEHIDSLDNGGHLAALPGSDMLYTVSGSLLSAYNLTTKELSTVGNIKTSNGETINGMVQMGFSPDGTLYGSSSKFDRIYKINLLTADAIDLGKIKAPSGSDLEYLDIAGGDLVFKQDGTLFIFGRAGGSTSERSIYIVKEGTSGLYAELFSGPFLQSTGMAILNGGRGDFVVSLYKKGVAIVDRDTGEQLHDVELFLDDEKFLPGWGDMSNACVEVNPIPKYTGSIFFEEQDCPIIADRLGDITNEKIFKKKDQDDPIASVLKAADISLSSVDGNSLSIGSSFFEISDSGQIINAEPTESAQHQIQRFYTPNKVELKMEFLGPQNIRSANTFGVYYYEKGGPTVIDMGEDSRVRFKELVSQSSSKLNNLVEFDIPSDHYFGFYLTKSIYGFTNYYYTENRFNSDVGFVQSSDEQRPDLLTDHFTFFNTEKGMVLAAEDSSMTNGQYMLGDQDYNDLIMGFFSCKDSRLIDPVNNVVDTGTPSDSGDAGLESVGDLSRGYALRDVLKANNIMTRLNQSTPKRDQEPSFGLNSNSNSQQKQTKGVHAGSSPIANFYQDAQVGFNLSNSEAYDVSILEELKTTLPSDSDDSKKWLGQAEERTPFDIPFVSNARAAIGLTYVQNQIDQAGIFVSATEGKVYNHSKGICDRTKSSVISAIQQIAIDGGQFYSAKISMDSKNIRDYAILFSVFINHDNQAMVDSHWLADDYKVPAGTKLIYNYQIWSKELTKSRNVAVDILNKIKSKYPLQYLNKKIEKPTAFISHATFKEGHIELSVINTESENIDVTITNPYFRVMQGTEGQLYTDRVYSLVPGESKLVIAYGQTIFDSLLYLNSTKNNWRDSVYLQNGSFTMVMDAHMGGKSTANMSYDCLSKSHGPKMAALFEQKSFNGCASVVGQTDKRVSVYRTTKQLQVKPNDIISFDYKSNVPMKVCLHFNPSLGVKCQSLVRPSKHTSVSHKLVEFLSASDLGETLPKLSMIEFRSEQSGDFEFGVQNLKVSKLKQSLKLINFSKLESETSITTLVNELKTQDVTIWSWSQGQWAYWSNSSKIESINELFDEPQSTLTQVEPGKAYWVMTSNQNIAKFKKFSSKISNELPKSKGWHLVGPRSNVDKDFSSKNIWVWSLNRLLATDIAEQANEESGDGMWIYN